MSRSTRLVTLAAVLLLSLPLAARAAAPPPETSSYSYTANMEPIGASPTVPGGPTKSDIAFWGNKAYQGTYWGFRIIDITNPASPTEIINYEDCRGSQGDVIIWENILVRAWGSPNANPTTTCDGETVQPAFEGVHVFDVSNPANPDLIASVATPTCGAHTASGVPDLANNRLIVYSNPSAGGNCAGFDIMSVPLNNPSSASLLGHFNTGRSCHDVSTILGDAMLVACAGGDGLTMLSIGGSRGGSITAPVQLWTKSFAADSVSIGHAASFSWDGKIVLFGHEPGGGTAPECEATDTDAKKTMFIMDSATGNELGRWVMPRPQTAQENCTIHNFNTVPTPARNIVVGACYQCGTFVVDFTDPSKPKEIAYADPAPLQPEFDGGEWSTHWYDGEIYASDITRGVLVWLLHDPAVAGARTLGHLNPQTQEFTIPFTGSLGKCKGKEITVLGTAAAEVLKGTAAADVISGGGGNDTISGKKGNDRICGGSGNDVLKGGSGNDILLGQSGKDTGKGGSGNDTFKGGSGKDTGSGYEKGKA